MHYAFKYFLENRELSTPTRKHYEKIANSWSGPIDRKTVRKYYNDLQIKSKHQYMMGLATMYEFYISDHEPMPNPFKGISTPPNKKKQRQSSLRRTVSAEAFEELKKSKHKFTSTALWQYYSGFSWVDIGNPNYVIEKDVIILERGKNGQECYIPITKEMRKLDIISGSELKFPFPHFLIDFEVDQKLYSKYYSQYRRFLKTFGITPHMLRHSFAANTLNEGKWDMEDVQAMLGHQSLNTTALYANVRKERILNKL